jgi:hypothetical protein
MPDGSTASGPWPLVNALMPIRICSFSSFVVFLILMVFRQAVFTTIKNGKRQ